MATLHNQKAIALSWQMSGQSFSCDGWGVVEVPDKFVDACLARGLPLGHSPVPAESRARHRVAAAEDAQSKSAFSQLKKERDEAMKKADEFKQQADEIGAELSKERDTVRRMKAEMKELRAARKQAESDKRAAHELLSDTAKKAEAAEEKVLKLKAESRAASEKRAKR